MTIWRAVLLAILLVTVPFLSACDLIGLGNSRAEQEREYYEQQLEAIKKAQEIHRQQQEDYNRRVQEGLNKWAEAYGEWQEKQQQQQIQQFGGVVETDNQS
jgi:ABC-type transport system involved in cytochrome bd biosynthesis fused ATPase/permease subunit